MVDAQYCQASALETLIARLNSTWDLYSGPLTKPFFTAWASEFPGRAKYETIKLLLDQGAHVNTGTSSQSLFLETVKKCAENDGSGYPPQSLEEISVQVDILKIKPDQYF